MASKSSEKKTTKKKRNKKSDGDSSATAAPKKRGRQPKVVEPYPHPFDMRRPMASAADEIEFGHAIVEGKKPSPNKGVMSAKQFGDAVRAAQAAVEADKEAPSIPPLYSMIRRQIANEHRATCIVSGQASKGKKPLKSHNIPDSLAKTFGDGDRVFTDGAGKVIPLRLCHKTDVRKLVVDAAENILTIAGREYVVGTTETSAVFLANGSKTGSYGANIIAGKQLSFDGMGSRIKNLVGQINDDFLIVNLDDATTPGAELAVPPGAWITMGHLVRDGKPLTPNQVRKLGDDTKGVKFVALEEPIVGNPVTQSALWSAVKRHMARAATRIGEGDDATTALDRFSNRPARSGGDADDPSDKAWRNLRTVQTRTNPNELNPFGLFNSQTDCIPVAHYGDSLDEEQVTFIIGARVGAEWTENRWEANYRLHPEEYEDETVEETVVVEEAPTPKPKRKRKPKTAEVSQDETDAPDDSAAVESEVKETEETVDAADANEADAETVTA